MSSAAITMTVLLSLADSSSLKDKRSVIRSILDRFGKIRNVAVSETGMRDSWAQAELTLSVVGDSPSYVEQEAERLLLRMEEAAELVVSVVRTERY